MATTLFSRARALARTGGNSRHQCPQANRRRMLSEEPLEQRTVLSAISPGASVLDADYTGDGTIDVEDIKLMSAWIGPEGSGSIYHKAMDLNHDGKLTRKDVFELAKFLRTTPGDVDYDGDFDSSDVICLFLHNQYEDKLVGNSTWTTGDVTGDLEFRSDDLIVMMQESVYEPDGDVNGDGRVDVTDIDIVNCWVGASGGDCLYLDKIDVNRDGKADREDVNFLVRLVGTTYGDADLDGMFGTGDLVAMMQGGMYETGKPATWIQGDFNGDHKFDSNDLAFALQESPFGLDVAAVDVAFAANVA